MQQHRHRRRPDRLAVAAMTALVLLVSRPSVADVVRLKVGADTFGQGWMFLDQDGVCKVVTAGHVIRSLDGKLRSTIALDGHNREWIAAAPTVASNDPDIAVLPIPGAAAPTVCGSGRLSAIGIARRVANLEDGLIRTTGDSEIRDIAVSRRASAIDQNDGGLFTVSPKRTGDVVKKGWSGSVVLDSQGPLGIVYEVDPETNEAYAVRIDVVRNLMAAAPAPPSSPDPAKPGAPTIVVLAGSTVDPAAGPDQLLSTAGATWEVQPKQHTIVFTLQFNAPQQIHHVALTTSWVTANRIAAIDVSTQASTSETDWTSARYCPAPAAGRSDDCNFLARTVAIVRILVKTRSDDPLELSDLSID